MKILRPHPWSKPQDGPVSRFLNRYVSAPVSSVLLKTDITPNQVTLAISTLSVPMLLLGLWGQVIAVGIVLQIASALDGCDGEIARLKNLRSNFGAILDTVSDYWIDSVGIMALGLALLKTSALPVTLIFVVITLTVAIRLITQFVVKSVPDPTARIYGDSRDVVTLLVLVGAVLSAWLSPWFLVGTLLFIDVWRIDNMVYRLYQASRSDQEMDRHDFFTTLDTELPATDTAHVP